MAHATALRTTSFCLLFTLTVAAGSSAGQQPVAASGADLGSAWQAAASFDAARPAAGLAVDVRLDLLRRAAESGGVLTLPLPDGTSMRFGVEWSQSDATQVFVAGPALGIDGDVSLTAVGDSLSGRVVVNGRLFVVRRAAGSDMHVVTELNQAALPPPGPPLVPAPEELVDPVAPEAPRDSNAFVDVMVVYTPGARAQIGSTGAMIAELSASINSSNVALANSGAIHRFRLVHHQEVAYAETNVMDTTLARLRNPSDGFMDDVPVLRNQYRADIVTLLSTDANYCGLGYLMGPSSINASFESFAYNVSLWNCANAVLAVAHEIGHNMGLHHDRPWAAGTPSFPYAYGYTVNGVGRDIMAYPYSCTQCPTRTIYSTPLFNFPGTGVRAGTVNEDNARALNGTSTAVANFRQSVCTATLSPAGATLPAAGGSGSISVNVAAAFCNWVSVNSNPAAVTITSGSSGGGPGVLTYVVSPNSGAASRTVTLTIGDQPFTIFQAGRNNAGDVDGDGKSEIAVFRPSTGSWYLLTSGTGFSVGSGYAWGASSDIPVSGDFDGDGRHDIVVFRPATGHWFVLKSSTNFSTSVTYQWGTGGDKPVPADYDGDGTTDLAIYRPSTGTWFVLTSTSGFASAFGYAWGASSDMPAPGDYDGDLRADLVVFRPSSGHWFILTSGSNYTSSLTYQWGTTGDIPVAGNYDGDNRTDIGIYRPSSGSWYVLTSSTNFTSGLGYVWGVSTDTPVPADYDGDGRTDLAVYRSSSAHWFILKSTTNFSSSGTYQWGTTGDVPVLRRQ